VLETLTQQLKSGANLAETQIKAAVAELVQEAIPAQTKADFLAALSSKYETEEELAGFAHELREMSVAPPLSESVRAGEILDIVGTGGDRLHTFNISTTTSLLASAGVRVAKHGNRAVTSKSGSADVLEALGIRLDASPAATAEMLEKHGFAFFFAPQFHPAFRHIAPARKICAQNGVRTIFNLLGPLLNPARPTAQLTGVPDPRWCRPLAAAHQALGVRRAMVVCGQAEGAWLDEFSTSGSNTIAEYFPEKDIVVSTMEFGPLQMQPAKLADLTGGDAATNAQILRDILAGKERGPKRDAVLLNAGAALFVVGRARSMGDGVELAEQLIASGQAEAKLRELIENKP
jgi:anthranilate phosphoribosyltransferase